MFGIDHEGHRLGDAEGEWFRLSPQEKFHENGIKWIGELSKNAPESYQRGSLAARLYAEEHCSWERSIDALEQILHASMTA